VSGQGGNFRGYRAGQRGRNYGNPPPPKPEPKPIQTIGNPELWASLQTVKDPNTNCTKTTRAMIVPGGVLVNTCTRGPGFATEALVFVPHATVRRVKDAKTATLVAAV
jgi:hypothetical protein